MGESPSQAGWYEHPEMVNTLCYWDGSAWTDKVQPKGDAAAIDDARKRMVGAIIALVIIVAFVIAIVAAV